MTTIIYDGSAIYADRNILKRTSPLYIEKGDKLFKSSCGEFAHAICGDMLHYVEDVPIEEYIRNFLTKYYSTPALKRTEATRLDDNKINTIKSICFILTRDKFFKSAVSSNDIFIDTTGILVAEGTGGHRCMGLLAGGMKIEDVFVEVNKFDPYSSSEFDVVKHDDLKPFVIR